MEFYMPTKIYHEAEAVRKHGEEMAHTGKKALIVTGHSSSKKNGALKDVQIVWTNIIQPISYTIRLPKTQRLKA